MLNEMLQDFLNVVLGFLKKNHEAKKKRFMKNSTIVQHWCFPKKDKFWSISPNINRLFLMSEHLNMQSDNI